MSSEVEVIASFQNHIDTIDINNDFNTFWGSEWKSITRQCLNVAKHTFVMRKAFEIFKSKYVLHQLTKQILTWPEIFADEEEAAILRRLCQHVGLCPIEFMFYGLNHHRNRCRKFCRMKV